MGTRMRNRGPICLVAAAAMGLAATLCDPEPVSAEPDGILHTGALVGVDKSSVTFKLKPKVHRRVVRGFEFSRMPMECDHPDSSGFDLGGVSRMKVHGRRFRGRSAGGTALGRVDARVEGTLTSGAKRAHGRAKFKVISKLVAEDPVTCRSGWVKWRTHRAGG
jgi:hypothetical protein